MCVCMWSCVRTLLRIVLTKLHLRKSEKRKTCPSKWHTRLCNTPQLFLFFPLVSIPSSSPTYGVYCEIRPNFKNNFFWVDRHRLDPLGLPRNVWILRVLDRVFIRLRSGSSESHGWILCHRKKKTLWTRFMTEKSSSYHKEELSRR